ncbi:MAG: (Fe-S)-binding protein [Nitrososphaerota archaeon]|nr:(Fe-S)-binding protein [Candidatus Bathyarchaeota archaeon]MDW8023757.1 (Fe-S)-binding protein [Nitrososphaerota archaeon]
MPLKDYEYDVWNCYRCSHGEYVGQWETKSSKFSKVCPSVTKYLWDNYACHGRMDCARALIDGKLNWTGKLVDAVYKCTLCAACDVQCKRMGVTRVLEVLEEIRIKCLKDGYLPLEHRKALDSIINLGNPFGIDERGKRLAWTKGLESKIKVLPKDKASVLLYTGSMYSLQPLVQGTLKSTSRVLGLAGVDFGVLENEKDDGFYAAQLGDKALFERLARENIDTFNSLGVNVIVTPDPHAYNAFMRYYPKVGKIEAEVFHVTQYVEKLIRDEKIKLKATQREIITYHDPCNLGRVQGVYDSPRNIISAIPGIELREMERTKENAWCCGAGGGVVTAYPDFMAWTATERVKEAEFSGASTIITACPFCEYALRIAVGKLKSPLKVQNIVELVEKSMKGGLQ